MSCSLALTNNYSVSNFGEFYSFKKGIKTSQFSKLGDSVQDYVNKEIYSFWTEIYDLKTSNYRSFDPELNKIKTLHLAKSVGLTIPETLITNSKRELSKFIKDQKKIICKPMCDPTTLQVEDKIWLFYTGKVTQEMVSELEENIFPTLVQEQITGVLELRVFYLDGECYSMAQVHDNKTETIDIKLKRNSKIRYVPFYLPEETNKKINILMKKLNLNSGSLDLIYTEDKKYIFLEVNPAGHYDQVGKSCNLYLDKKIAKTLS